LPDRLSDYFAWREVRDQRGIWQDGVGRRDINERKDNKIIL